MAGKACFENLYGKEYYTVSLLLELLDSDLCLVILHIVIPISMFTIKLQKKY